MNKFNRNFNTRVKQLQKWQNVLMRLLEFEGLVNSYDGLTPNQLHDIRRIHRKLLECQEIAKEHYLEVKFHEREY